MSYTIPNKALLSQLTASSHVSASAFYGDGSNLTNIAAGGLTSVATGGNITGSGISGNPIGVKPDPMFNTVTASVVTASDIITDYVNFNSNADPLWDNGRMWYNNTTHELNYWTEVDGFNIKIGQQLVQRCKNDQGSPLIKGSVVHITGSISSADTPRVRLADWTNDGLSANTLGLVADDIDTGGEGYVIVQGILKGYNTNGYAPGEMLYLSSSGQITNIKPSAPKHTVSVGQVVRKQIESGSIYVSIQNGYEIGELHDVLTNGKATGDLLVWDSSIPAWKNTKTLSGSYIISGSQTITGSLIATNSITSSNGISGRLYGTASYALDADLFNGQNSSLFALKTDVSGAVTGGLTPYATLTGVSASFTTPTQVSGAITGALSPYVLSSALSSSFVTNTAATASLAFLTASNTFTSNNNFIGQVTASSLLVDTNTLFVDSVNNRVGVGTITPSATMSIGPNPAAALNANEMLQLSKNSDCYMTIRNATSSLYQGSNSNFSYAGTVTNTDFKLFRNGSDKLTLDSVSLSPSTNVGMSLGTVGRVWNNILGSLLDVDTASATSVNIVSGSFNKLYGYSNSTSTPITLETNLAFRNGKGIDFSSTGGSSGVSSHLLDDYEEGTWSPNPVTWTYSGIANSLYTKIGNIVNVRCLIISNPEADINEDAYITGLPYSANADTAAFVCCRKFDDSAADKVLSAYISGNQIRLNSDAFGSYYYFYIFASYTTS